MFICVKKGQQILKLSLFSSILLLAACGQKGPLYLEKPSDIKDDGHVIEHTDTDKDINKHKGENPNG